MDQLIKTFHKLNIPFDDQVIIRFEKYMNGILKWNKMVNLTTIIERESFIKKHFIDSLLSVPSREFQHAEKIIDVGTGAGFPGIPLALIASDKQFVLIDSLNKRIKIIEELCDEIGIDNVQLIHGRAEELGKNKQHRESYDLCVSRAVANLSTLSEYCLPFIKKGGYFLAYKGPGAGEEMDVAKKAITVLGGRLEREEEAALSDFELEHRILFIRKEKNTPSKYPRKAGTPSKEPIK